MQQATVTAILRWSGAHERAYANSDKSLVVVRKEKEEVLEPNRKKYPAGLFFYFSWNAELTLYVLQMMASNNIFEQEQ